MISKNFKNLVNKHPNTKSGDFFSTSKNSKEFLKSTCLNLKTSKSLCKWNSKITKKNLPKQWKTKTTTRLWIQWTSINLGPNPSELPKLITNVTRQLHHVNRQSEFNQPCLTNNIEGTVLNWKKLNAKILMKKIQWSSQLPLKINLTSTTKQHVLHILKVIFRLSQTTNPY